MKLWFHASGKDDRREILADEVDIPVLGLQNSFFETGANSFEPTPIQIAQSIRACMEVKLALCCGFSCGSLFRGNRWEGRFEPRAIFPDGLAERVNRGEVIEQQLAGGDLAYAWGIHRLQA